MDEEPITVYNVAQYSRKIHYNYRDQLECVVIIAGYDEFKLGQVYQVSSGGYTTRQPVYISGSGGSIIHGYMNMNWKPGMETDEALKVHGLKDKFWRQFFNFS
jgi:20S proteasome alpha/beta subunit